MHTCPMSDGPKPHVGGPVMPPGVPTVYIGGAPAATLGNLCTCMGPPDSIIQGSMGVLIGGKPAARQGDMTAHGGIITVGCPTVLIGDFSPLAPQAFLLQICPILAQLGQEVHTEADKQKQAQLQEQLEPAFYQNLTQLPADQQLAAFNTLKHYEQTADAADMARLSNAVYDGSTPPGFARMSDEEVRSELGLNPNYLNDSDSGFKSAIYRSTTGGEPPYTVAFAGTEPEMGDIGADLAQGVGMPNEQYDRAMVIGNRLARTQGPNGFQTTGHSLGGGLASATSATTGAPGTTFNAAGLHQNTTRRDNGVSDETRAANAANVNAYHNSRDPLNVAQDNRRGVLASLGVAAAGLVSGIPVIGPWLAPATLAGAGGLAQSGALPQAYGNRIEVPAASRGLPTQHGIQTMVDLLDQQTRDDLGALQEAFGCS